MIELRRKSARCDCRRLSRAIGPAKLPTFLLLLAMAAAKDPAARLTGLYGQFLLLRRRLQSQWGPEGPCDAKKAIALGKELLLMLGAQPTGQLQNLGSELHWLESTLRFKSQQAPAPAGKAKEPR
jgi:hypothetical protein